MPVFLPSTVRCIDGSFFVENAVVTRTSTVRRQNIGIWAGYCLFRLWAQVSLPCILEVRPPVALGCVPFLPHRPADDPVLVQQRRDTFLGDGPSPRPLRPRLLGVGRQVADDGLGRQVVEGRRLE